jgi:hypothetical protein
MNKVTCSDCKNFRHPGRQYETNSMGSCEVMEMWLDKFPLRHPPSKQYDQNYARLGGNVWMPFIERQCEKYEVKK